MRGTVIPFWGEKSLRSKRADSKPSLNQIVAGSITMVRAFDSHVRSTANFPVTKIAAAGLIGGPLAAMKDSEPVAVINPSSFSLFR
jgi:hypothetical protein